MYNTHRYCNNKTEFEKEKEIDNGLENGWVSGLGRWSVRCGWMIF